MNRRLDTKDFMFIGLGGVCVLVTLALYMILGENSVVFANDQLDGEVIGYILHAKYLFSGVTNYPEVMNGISANGLFPPAPLVILLYRVLSPFWAFAVNQIVCMFIGFWGMYLCLRLFCDYRIPCFFVSILFAYLPLLSVYGLCQFGVPILAIAFYELYQGRNKIISYVVIAFYASMSSLVLIGYAILGFVLLYMVYLLVKKQYTRLRDIAIGWGIMLVIYLAFDSSLIMQIFKIGEQTQSHKEDLVRNGQNCIESFITVFFKGTLHTPSHQQVIVVAAILVVIYTLIFRKRMFCGGEKIKVVMLYILFGFNVLCGAFYSFVQSPLIAEFRNNVGGIVKNFQMDRVFWLTVPSWYFILGILLDLLICEAVYWYDNKRKIIALFPTMLAIVAAIGMAGVVFYYSDINKNLHRLRGGESYDKLTWDDYYAPDVFSEIEEFIGEDKSSYRTISFGLHPATAIYNGFYTLDAYSNNYDLDYKHKFRNIIAGELDKDESLEKYYDEWGCRCYVLSSELGYSNLLISKASDTHVSELSFNAKAAKEMGADYLFSAVAIDNADEVGLKLMRDEPFSTDTSYVQIYLYQIL
jgi:hypothetical protein